MIKSARAFAVLLHMFRKLAGLSQEQVGHRLNLSPGAVGYRERATRQVTVEAAAEHLAVFDYVLLVMHIDDARRLPGLMISPPADGPPCTCTQVLDTGHAADCPRNAWARGYASRGIPAEAGHDA